MSALASSAAYDPAERADAVYALRTHARIVNEPDYAWRRAAVLQLNELGGLPVGWDGYRAPPVRFENASFALRMLESICGTDAPLPQIVPGSGGDLQVEWHLLGGDLELHVRAPNDVHAWRRIAGQEGGGDSIHLKNDFTEIARWLGVVAGQAGAANAAAA